MPRSRPDSSARSDPGARPAAGRADPPRPAITTPQFWGTRPARLGVFAIIGATLLGLVTTVVAGIEPGLILGIFLVAGTIAAALAVRAEAVYLIFPVPALAYAIAALVAGLIHDRGTDTSSTALALSAAQWIAGGFIAMTVATVLAVLIGGYRWLRNTRAPGV
jgi:Domain of unknown function (DUF6542)